jgi:hypothetical protein
MKKLLSILLVSLALLVANDANRTYADDGGGIPALLGSWHEYEAFDDGSYSWEELWTFSPGSWMNNYSGAPPSTLTDGQGTWVSKGNGRFHCHGEALSFDNNGVYNGYYDIVVDFQILNGGTTNTLKASFQFIDLKGVVTNFPTASAHGRKIIP